MRHRVSHGLPAALCAAAVLCVPAAAKAQSNAGCDNRVNDTSRKLVPCITTDDLWNHMKALQAIADANPGADGHPSRNSGEPGYKASADYVAAAMRKAGFDGPTQPFPFPYTSYVGTPSFSEVSPTPRSFTLISDWNPGNSQGDATGAQVKPAGSTLMPPTGGSHSGCDPSDFGSSFAGKIALIQRGTCNFGVKVLNAEAAGAAGVVIFNEGNTPERTPVFPGSMSDADGNPFVASIPVAFTSFDIGQSLYNQYTAG